MICTFRNGLGRNAPRMYGVAAAIAGFVGISLEKKSRRTELALYVANLTTELVYNMCVRKGIIKPVKHGSTVLFGVASSVLLYALAKEPENCALRSAILFFLGKEDDTLLAGPLRHLLFWRDSKSLQRKITFPVNRTKHCLHRDPCYMACITALVRSWLIGSMSMLAINLVKTAISGRKLKAEALLDGVFATGNFLGGLAGGYRLLNCLLRKLRDKEDGWNDVLAGGTAGALSYHFFPHKSTELSMYVASKAAQSIWDMMIIRNVVAPSKYGSSLLFSGCVGLMFWAAVFEPHDLRPSYFKFLVKFGAGQFTHLDKYYDATRHLLRPNH